MALPKGVSGNPNGRPAGIPNKATSKFKEALNKLFEDNADQMMHWLAQIDEPKERFAILKDFAEFIYPKLARQEIVGDPEQPQVIDITVKGKILSLLTEDQLRQIEADANS